MATEPAQPAHIQYTVTNQERTRILTPGGKFVNVWQVSYEAPNGTHSTVEIPLKDFNAHYVNNAIQEQLRKIIAVDALGKTPPPTGS